MAEELETSYKAQSCNGVASFCGACATPGTSACGFFPGAFTVLKLNEGNKFEITVNTDGTLKSRHINSVVVHRAYFRVYNPSQYRIEIITTDNGTTWTSYDGKDIEISWADFEFYVPWCGYGDLILNVHGVFPCLGGCGGPCQPGYECDTSRDNDNYCVSVCEGEPCSATCPQGTCPAGQTCVGGVCTATPPPVECGGKQCSPECPEGSCPGGEGCVDGECVPIEEESNTLGIVIGVTVGVGVLVFVIIILMVVFSKKKKDKGKGKHK